jgi:hypothetical protein
MAQTDVRTREEIEDWLDSMESLSNVLLRDTLRLFESLRSEEADFVKYVWLANAHIDEPARILEIQLELIEEIRRRSTFISSASAKLTTYMRSRREDQSLLAAS